MPTTRTLTLLATAATLLALAGSAHAQNALGDGRALDRNLQTGSGGLLPGGVRRDPIQDQIRLNNAIVNGTATGGRSFRGSTGYRATDQFSGRLGSDDLYSFQRDSATSALTGLGVRGSDALRYQFGLTTGDTGPSFLAQTGIAPGGTFARSSTVTTSSGTALRSTSEFISSRAMRPALVGTRSDEYGAEYTAKASPLLGISWVKTRESPLGASPESLANPAVPLSGLESSARGMPSLLDKSNITGMTRAREDDLKPRPESMVYTRVMDQLRTDVNKPIESAVPGKIDPNQPPTPEKVEDPSKAKPKAPLTLDEQLENLRNQLRGQPKDAKADPSRPQLRDNTPTRDNTTAPNKPGPGDDKAPAKQGDKSTEKATDKSPFPTPQLPSALIDSLRRTAIKPTETLSQRAADIQQPAIPDPKGPVDQSFYTRNMDEGQDLIGKGRFFDAEDRFTRAIAAAPGEPMARIGRIHAQLAGGLYLSAATNYRNLIKDHPEIVALRYGPRLLPTAERSKVIADQLRSEMERSNSALQRDSALLLAYLGHQTNDAAMIAEGLDALAVRIDANDSADQTLVQLLRGAWGK